jgi:hypothetical protein
MIDAVKAVRDSVLFTAYLRTAMHTAIHQDMDPAVGVPAHDGRLPANSRRLELPRKQDFALMPDKHPCSLEDRFHLPREDSGIGVYRLMDTVMLNQRLNLKLSVHRFILRLD